MIELRFTQPGDLPALSRLFEERFGHPLSEAEWEWKYRQLPGEARSAVAVATTGEEKGRLLAHAGLLGLPARYRTPAIGEEAREGLLWQLVDWVGTPRYTGLRPPLIRLGRWLLGPVPGPDDAPWNFGFPSPRHMDLGRRVFGYGDILRFRERVGQLTDAAGPLPAALPAALRIEASDHWTGDAADLRVLWEACCPFGIRRDEDFLRWRYWARPGRYYRFYRIRHAAPSGGEGLAVFAFVGDEALAGELWLPPADGGPSLAAALPAVAEDLLASGLERWRFWPAPPEMSGAATAPDLLAGLGLEPGAEILLGFRPRGGGLVGGARAGTGPPELPPEADGFYCAMGDYDST